MVRFLYALVVAVLLGGCSTTERAWEYLKGGTDNAEPPSPLVNFQPKIKIIELWDKRTGIGTDKQYLKLSPVITGQRLYIVDSDGRLEAMDATNGKSLWTHNTRVTADIDGKSGWFRGKKLRVTGGPGYGENSVIIGTGEGEVITFSADKGEELWRNVVTSEVLSAPKRAQNVVIVRTLDGKIFGLSAENGRRLWIYDRTVPPLTLRGTSTPVIYAGAVIAGFDGGKLAALDIKTGRLIWESSIARAQGTSELERMVDIDSEPLILDGIIYVATFQGHIAALQLDSGRILWTREVSSHAGFSGDEDNLYITDANSNIWALDRYTGTTVWKKEDLYARHISAPGSIGDYIVVGDFEGYLHWIDKRTGRFAARNSISDDPVIAKPITVGRVLYAYSSDGTLAAYTYR